MVKVPDWVEFDPALPKTKWADLSVNSLFLVELRGESPALAGSFPQGACPVATSDPGHDSMGKTGHQTEKSLYSLGKIFVLVIYNVKAPAEVDTS